MRTRAEIVAAARSMIGTPFHHQGRCPGVGIDCIGLDWLSHVAAGFAIPEPPCDYGREALDDRLLREIALVMDPITLGESLPGDTLVFAFRRGIPQHLAIRSDYGMIHCWSGAGYVAEHQLTRSWINRCLGGWRPRGIIPGEIAA